MDQPNAYYIDNRIVIDRRMAGDASVAIREYNHHVLFAGKARDWRGPFAALESGLADYFACSFLNNPNLGEKSSAELGESKSGFIRSLANTKTYEELSKASEWEFIYIGTEVWGGFFWDIRGRLAPATVDSLVASTWLSFALPQADAEIAPAFLAALLKAAEAQGAQAVSAVRSSAAARKLPQPE